MQELKQLLGGMTSKNFGDVLNTNKSSDCECVYDNSTSIVSNMNAVTGCNCKCIRKTTK